MDWTSLAVEKFVYWTQYARNDVGYLSNRAKDEASCMTKKAELKDKDAAEAKKSIDTVNSFEWKSTQAHQQFAATMHNLGILISNTNQKEIYVSLLEQINCYGRFYVDIKGQCHQEEGQGNDKNIPVMNLDTDPINDHLYFDAVYHPTSRLVSEPRKDAKKLSIPQRLERLEASIGGTFVQRISMLEQCCGIVYGEGMKLEDRIDQLEQFLE